MNEHRIYYENKREGEAEKKKREYAALNHGCTIAKEDKHKKKRMNYHYRSSEG